MAQLGSKKNKSVKSKANEHEKVLAKKLNGVRQPCSGAFGGHKGDIKLKHFLLDSKETEAAMINVYGKDLTKITREAMGEGKYPAIVLTVKQVADITEEEWVAIPISVFSHMVDRQQEV